MQHVLGMILRNNSTEIFDDATPGKESYSFMGLQAAVNEGNSRLRQNPEIIKINIYKVFDGVKTFTADGSQHQLVYFLLP